MSPCPDECARATFDAACSSRSRLSEASSEEAQEAGSEVAKKWRTRLSEGRMVADTKWILATRPYVLTFMPARRPSRFLWKQILKRTQKNGVLHQHSPPPIQSGYGSDGATRSNERSLMPLPQILRHFLAAIRNGG